MSITIRKHVSRSVSLCVVLGIVQGCSSSPEGATSRSPEAGTQPETDAGSMRGDSSGSTSEAGEAGEAGTSPDADGSKPSGHPRVMLTEARLQAIKSALPTSTALQVYLNQVTTFADNYVDAGPPIAYTPSGGQPLLMMPETGGTVAYNFSYYLTPSSTAPNSPKPGYYQVSSGGNNQDLLEAVAMAISNLAAAYVFTGDTKYSAALNTWALAVTTYPDWDEAFEPIGGEPLPFQPDPSKYTLVPGDNGPDLATANLFYALAMAYDWGYSVLPSATLQALHASLMYHGSLVALTAGPVTTELNSGYSWWRTGYMQNHNAVAFSGLTAAAAALLTEEPTAAEAWLALAIPDFASVQAILPSDGATPEGIGYGNFLKDFMLRARDIIFTNQGVDIFNDSSGHLMPFWQQTGAYTMYHINPAGAWTVGKTIFGFGDVDEWPWNGPDTILRSLATLTNNGDLQSFADLLDKTPGANATNEMWPGLLYYDTNLASTNFADSSALPLLEVFPQYGEAASRSDWTSPTGSLLQYRCGPLLGRGVPYTGVGSPTVGSGHIAPTAGSFSIFAGNEELLRPSGYIVAKWTDVQNTLVFQCPTGSSSCNPAGQIGQLGEAAESWGMNINESQLSSGQICGYDPTSYWESLKAAPTSLGLTLPAKAPTPISDLCKSSVVTKQLKTLCATTPLPSGALALCQKTPELTAVAPGADWTLPSTETGGVDYVLADTTAAYDPVQTGMSQYLRHFIYLRNHNVLLVVTEIQLSQSMTMNLYYHTTEVPNRVSPSPSGTYVVNASGKDSPFEMYFFEPTTTTLSTAAQSVGPDINTLQVVTLTSTGSQWTSPAAFSWAPDSTTTPERVSYELNPPTTTTSATYAFTLTSSTGTVLTVTVNPTLQSVKIQ